MSEKHIFNLAIAILAVVVLGGTYYLMQHQGPDLPADTSPTVTTADSVHIVDDASEPVVMAPEIPGDTSTVEQAFLRDGLKTNTAVRSIDLKAVLDGGPGKDGIPSIDDPKFTTIADADSRVADDTLGLFVEGEETKRFYPYNILVWHEIVNDVIDGRPILVTFCPLCGSAIVFYPEHDEGGYEFGVSGKLYDSNLLMYDRDSESLWSQITGEAVVGDKTGKKLQIYPSQIMTFAQLKESHPNAQVLSPDTGFVRDYSFYPYGDYDNNDALYFPVSVQDARLPAKTIMHIVNTENHSVAFDRVKLVDAGEAVATLPNDTQVIATEQNGEITVTYANDPTGQEIPGYTAMWFSWAAHHQEDGVVWPTI